MTQLPRAFQTLPRVALAKLPTPIDELAKLSQALGGPQLLVKRDDLTGLATGGNKTRKLEFLIADALKKNADCVITAGGPQSNHCRQTAAAAAIAGLDCYLVLGGSPQPPIGNLLLDQLLGATVHWAPRPHRNSRMSELAAAMEADGRRPYVIPVGGSNSVGALGYVAAMFEFVAQLAEQGRRVDRIFFATSSGGTQAGLVLGARLAGFAGRVTAISIDQTPDESSDEKFLSEVCRVANGAAELLGVEERLAVSDFDTDYGYLGDGYGVVGELERETIKLVARTEGLLVGPVYTARALGAMLDQIRRGAFAANETWLFWHTGDETALHAYAEALTG
ncbi:D-cysteine desulfhydrase family protein [Lacipirellula sp.]|uniref:D-cysteine desulfhydrase family protein n=1 Tax=Lacipirellula sp. TaxID=2691419 RepID=UPI003D11233B